MKTTRSARGLSLFTVLVVISLLALLIGTMATLYLTNLRFCVNAKNGELAHQEAESALQEAVSRIVYSSDFGSQGTEVIRGSTLGLPGQEAFHELSFANSAIQRSLYSDGSSHLYAVGFCRGQYRMLEAIVKPAEYGYALATEGTIVSVDQFIARGLSDAGAPALTNRPGNVLTNSDCQFNGSVDISGSLRLAGRIAPAPADPSQFVVSGGIEEGVARRTLPVLELNELDQQLPPFNKMTQVVDERLTASQFISSGALLRDGDLTFTGNLTLEQAVVRVRHNGSKPGNLTILGELSGSGLLVADGNITIASATMQTPASQQIISAADGQVSLQSGFYRGLVYSHSQLNLSDCTVLGSAVANPSSGSSSSGSGGLGGGARVQNVTFLANPRGSSYDAVVQAAQGVTQGNSDAPFAIYNMNSALGYIDRYVSPADEMESTLNGLLDATTAGIALDRVQGFGVRPDGAYMLPLLQQVQDSMHQLVDANLHLALARQSGNPAAIQLAQDTVNTLKPAAQAQNQQLIDEMRRYQSRLATPRGSTTNRGTGAEPYHVHIDLQKFLARSEAVRIVYFKEHSPRF